jgi:hypothetical protein
VRVRKEIYRPARPSPWPSPARSAERVMILPRAPRDAHFRDPVDGGAQVSSA